MKLSKERMEYIIDNKLIEKCTEDEKKQVFNFAFGKEFMEQPDDMKGTLKTYEEDKEMTNLEKFLVPCKFAIEDDKVFQGFYDKSNKYWNGWLNPYVTDEVRKEILEYYCPPKLRDELLEKRKEAFVTEDFDEENPWLEYWDIEPDKKTGLFYFGGMFIWEEVEEKVLEQS